MRFFHSLTLAVISSNMSEYLEKWLKNLNVKQIDSSNFEFFDFRICFNYKTYQRSSVYENTIAIFDMENNDILYSYDKHSIGYNQFLGFDKVKKEKSLLKTLIKIIADAPTFYLRKTELKHFEEAIHSKHLSFSNKCLSIENFTVYKLYYETEKCCRYRVGKDDTYKITQKTEWYATYNNSIIETNYLRSLLPKPVTNEYLEDVYGPSVIYGDTKEFQLDEKETLKFRNAIDINTFFEI